MELFVFFICSWIFISILLFIWNGHPGENEKWSAFIFGIILISGILAIAGMVILFIIGMIMLGILALFGIIG
jgi:hypothetical protein